MPHTQPGGWKQQPGGSFPSTQGYAAGWVGRQPGAGTLRARVGAAWLPLPPDLAGRVAPTMHPHGRRHFPALPAVHVAQQGQVKERLEARGDKQYPGGCSCSGSGACWLGLLAEAQHGLPQVELGPMQSSTVAATSYNQLAS